jgi:acyl carrier protein
VSGFDDIVAKLLDLSPEQLTDDLGPANLGTWTSLRHVQLMAELQRSYDVRFAPREMRSARTVGKLRELLRAKGIAL